MGYDAAYKGLVYKGVDLPVYTLRADGNMAAAYGASGATLYVALTGYTQTSKRGNLHYQTTDGYYIYLPDGWTEYTAVNVPTYSQSQAQALVNKIIKNNIAITQNNLVCARYASKFTAEQQEQIRDLQNRVVARENALKDQGLCANVQTSYPKGYAELEPYLAALMDGNAIGLATWAIVVIAASVVLATSTAAYFAYRYFADESEKDVKYSQDLTRVLQSKLTESEYQQLLDETKGIVTKSRIKQAASSWGSMAKYALYAVAGFTIYKLVMSKINSRKNE